MTLLRTDVDTGAMSDSQGSPSPQPQPGADGWDGEAHEASVSPMPTDSGTGEPLAKKRRKDVSPDKYFEILEEDNSSKFGCSRCGNVYKWKKSLNKHWKEKHNSDPGDTKPRPAGMEVLLQQGNYIQTRLDTRQVFHKMLLEKITVKNKADAKPTTQRPSVAKTLGSQPTSESSPAQKMGEASPLTYSSLLTPGLFNLRSNGQSLLLTLGQKLLNSLNSPFQSSSTLDLSPQGMDETDGIDDTVQPLDYSKHKTPLKDSFSPEEMAQTCIQNPPTNTDKVTETLAHYQQAKVQKDEERGNLSKDKVSGVEVMDATIKPQVNQISSQHVVKCPMCPKQFPVFGALETHFLKCHTVCSNLHFMNRAVSKNDSAYEMEEGEIDPTHSFPVDASMKSVMLPAPTIFDGTAVPDSEKEQVTDKLDTKTATIPPNFLGTSVSATTAPLSNAGEQDGVIFSATSPDPSTIASVVSREEPGTDSSPGFVQGKNIESQADTVSVLRSFRKRKEPGETKDLNQLKVVLRNKISDSKDDEQRDYKCEFCSFRAKWPHIVMEHMKIHSSPKPYRCPNCSYASRWKWDVTKHLQRCGNGGKVQVLVDESTKQASSSHGPPNVTVTPDGDMVQCHKSASPEPKSLQKASPKPGGQADVAESHPTSLKVADPVTTPTVASQASDSSQPSQEDTGLLIVRETCKSVSSSSTSVPSRQSPPAQASLRADDSIASESRGQFCCDHCSFSSDSVAELTRHQVMYSHKPYRCEECGYSTKWKHDLKKHKCPYRRFIKNNELNQGSQKTERMKCTSCPFESNSRKAFSDHIKKSHSTRSSGKKSPTEVLKFKCKQCQFMTNDFSTYIEHRQSHKGENEPPRQSSPVFDAEEPDDARLKHPRKKVNSYSCKRCSFVCTKSTELLDHRKEIHDIYQCLYCPERFDVKDGLLDHLLHVHPDINIGEWCLYFRADNDDDLNNNNSNSSKGDGSKLSAVNKNNISQLCDNKPTASDKQSVTELLEEGKEPIVYKNHSKEDGNRDGVSTCTPSKSDGPKGSSSIKPSCEEGLRCKWCGEGFHNVIRLYSHVQTHHKEQFHTLQMAEGVTPKGNESQQKQVGVFSPKDPEPSKASDTESTRAQVAADAVFRVPILSNITKQTLLPFSPSTGLNLQNLILQKGAVKPPTGPSIDKAMDIQKNGQHGLVLQPRLATETVENKMMMDVQQYRSMLWNNQDISRCLLCFMQQDSPLAILKHLQQQHPDFVKGVKWPDMGLV